MTIDIIHLSPQDVAARHEGLAFAYEAVYSSPPGAGARFADMLMEQSRRDGFRLRAALDRADNGLVAFGYGFTGQPGQPWRDSLAAAMGAEVGGRWLRDYFEFAEFGVVPAWRRHGVSGRLYDSVFGDVPHRRAVLTVREGNEPARHFYERRGWVELHHGFFAPSGRGPYTVMGRELVETPVSADRGARHD